MKHMKISFRNDVQLITLSSTLLVKMNTGIAPGQFWQHGREASRYSLNMKSTSFTFSTHYLIITIWGSLKTFLSLVCRSVRVKKIAFFFTFY